MILDRIGTDTSKRLALLGATLLLLASIKAVIIANGYPMLETYAPEFQGVGLAKLFLSALAAAMLVAALAPYFPSKGQGQTVSSGLLNVACGTSFAIVVAIAISVQFWPKQIDGFVSEGNPVSIATEAVFAVAVVALAMAAWKARRRALPKFFGLGPALVTAAMAACVLLILLEEASYGQHWIGFSTPEAFSANEQNETNLHNFFTHRFELAFYSAAIIAFVLLPFFWPSKSPRWLKPLDLFIPPREFALAALPLCGMWYYTWNFVFFQFWFFCGLVVAYHFWREHSSRLIRNWAAVMGITLGVAQTHLLLNGHMMGQGRELTEVNEFIIALAVLAYGLVLHRRIAQSAIAGQNS